MNEQTEKRISKGIFVDIVSRIAEYYRKSTADGMRIDPTMVGLYDIASADDCIKDVLVMVSECVGTHDGLSLYEYMVLNWAEFFGKDFDKSVVSEWYEKFTEVSHDESEGPFRVRVKGTSVVLRAFLYRDNRDKVALQNFVGEYLSYRNNILVIDRGRETRNVYPGNYVVEVPDDSVERKVDYCVVAPYSFKQLFDRCE